MNNEKPVTRREVLKNIGTAGATGLAVTAAASTPAAAQQGGGVYYGCTSGASDSGVLDGSDERGRNGLRLRRASRPYPRARFRIRN